MNSDIGIPDIGTEVSYHILGAPSYQFTVAMQPCGYLTIASQQHPALGTRLESIMKYHRIGSLLPKEGTQPRYVQLWFFDTHNEIRNRLGAFMDNDTGEEVDGIIRTNSRQYNSPTVVEVAALIINDFGDEEPMRDIVVNKKHSGSKRISELHPSYIALQYPLLFPYGEDGYHDKIPYDTNTGKHKTNRDYVTMKEYY
ncbi:hypothetical protein Tco_0417009, partial [Tanacetum coccineum]